MKKIELLSPVGDFECLKAAVQNGADAVYLGVENFNARSNAKNFNLAGLCKAVDYSHLRDVKVFLTLNTLLKNSELPVAINLANQAYSFGIDGIIVQDLGLASFLIKNFPNLPIHASTQMTCHNLDGVKELEKRGFKRIVLARELSLDEIRHIKSNTSCEIEVFAHGALCICYSGQCLYSSLIGGRSGNRGKCAQGCRLPYSLLENGTCIDTGYLLSPKDLCSLELLPELISTGITSLKIEGRMKSPEYVSMVTKTYRKYIDLFYSNVDYIIDSKDKENLLQVFNRGGFSSGHLQNDEEKKDFIFKETPGNTGICIGTVTNYNSNKGHISLNLNNLLEIGDTISFENESSKYTVSELMINNNNVKLAHIDEKITIGRMKGNIKLGDKIYKLKSKSLSNFAINSYSLDNKKLGLSAILTLHLGVPMSLEITDSYGNKVIEYSECIPEKSINMPITKEKLINQLNKLGNTPFYFKTLEINLEDNLFVPRISSINELRRTAINNYSNLIIRKYKRPILDLPKIENKINNAKCIKEHKISLLLNNLNLSFNYSNLDYVDKLYVPLKFFYLKEYSNILNFLAINFKLYIYLPNIFKPNFTNLFKNTINSAVSNYKISGFVLSNLGYFNLLEEYKKNYEFIANFNFNIFNNNSCDNLDLSTITISPELNKEEINDIALNYNFLSEFIVYGKLPLMTMSYCPLGNSIKCYPKCSQKCKNNSTYFLKDRIGFLFKLVPDNMQTISTLYNSKTTSIMPSELNFVDFYRIDILDETIEEINNIINIVKSDNRFEGKNFTNGNLNRIV